MPKVIIFDCWETLFTTDINPHPFRVFAERIGQSVRDRTFVKSFETHLMLDGYADLRAPVGRLLDEWGLADKHNLIPELVAILDESTRHQVAFADTVATLTNLKTDYRLVLLTNSFKQGLDALRTGQNLDQYFDLILPSFEIHHIKPAREFFNEVIEHYKLPPAEMVMVGDNLLDDIKPAENLGMKGILLDRRGRYPGHDQRVTTLEEVVGRLDVMRG